MQPPLKHPRINVAELKAQIVMKLGTERSKHYFNYLNRLPSLELSKVEFEKLCVQVVGRENIPLHNQLIRSILKNACSANPPPPPTPDDEGVKTHGVHIFPVSTCKVRTNLHARRPLQAPIGVPFCPVRVGVVRRGLSLPTSGKCVSASNFGGLLDSIMLREHMEPICVAQGLQVAITECANLLNNGLDAYLKRIIGSCVGLVGARFGREQLKNSSNKQQTCLKFINGRPSNVMHKDRRSFPISLLDFRAAMELNPQQLGEDWSLLLERICVRSCDIQRNNSRQNQTNQN